MITFRRHRAHRIGVAAQWESPVAVGPRNTALRLLPFHRSSGSSRQC